MTRDEPSQCDRILAVLADGRPHRMEEVHERAGFSRLNSRVSELRKRGHVIECDRTGGLYVYRLIRFAEREPQAPPSASQSGGQQHSASPSADTRQLDLFGNAA